MLVPLITSIWNAVLSNHLSTPMWRGRGAAAAQGEAEIRPGS